MKRKTLLPILFIVPLATSLAWGQEPEILVETEETEIVQETVAESEEHSHDAAETHAEGKSADLLNRIPEAALDFARKIDKGDVLEFSKKLFVESDDKWGEIKKKLEESGLDEKTMKTVRKALEGSERGALKFIDKAMIVGPEGARDVKLFFQSLGGELAESEVAQRLWKQMREAFLEAGVAEDQISKAEEIWKEKLAPANYKIGVRCAEISPALRAQLPLEGKLGLVVEEIFERSPAEKADLQVYDVLIQANGQALTDVEQLVSAVQESGKKGEPVQLTFLRRGETRDVAVMADREKSEAASAVVEWVEGHSHHPHAFGPLFGGQGSHEGAFGEPPVEAIEALEGQVKALTETIEALRREMDAREVNQDRRHHQDHHRAHESEHPSSNSPSEDHEDHHEDRE